MQWWSCDDTDNSERPWRWWNIFHDFDYLIAQVMQIHFQHIPGEKNYLTDFLAKSGMKRNSFLKLGSNYGFNMLFYFLSLFLEWY
ncbi:hypothetical protein GQ457_06G022360 [Hibiscus cannabinus]